MKDQSLILIFSLFILLSFNCTRKEESSTTDNYLINNSTHSIELNYYYNGLVQLTERVNLQPNETKNVLHNFSRGKGNNLSYGRKNSFFDSAILVFDDTLNVTHYSFKVDTTGKKGLAFISSRNIMNPANYKGGKIGETKYSARYEYKFTFIDQDFKDAQK